VLYRCYAKINLTLEILRRRDDGFHELASLVHTISLADDLRVDPANELLTRVEGLDIDPETNLVSRAAELLTQETRERRGAELSLVKRIPAAAGLGGGSTDAATTLVALNTLWGSRLGLADLERVAGGLGSDVPFFIKGGAALMRGRGEQLTPLPPIRGQWLVLLVPPHDISDKTRRLYGALEPSDFSLGTLTQAAAEQVRTGATPAAEQFTNGFTRVAKSVFPGLSEVWKEAEHLARRSFFLSGAGPALFAFAKDRADARHQQSLLVNVNAETFAVRTVKHARASLRFAPQTSIGYI
jgi:4-diphosphocytidyl-2-C-methyl-D-erythritol kinase